MATVMDRIRLIVRSNATELAERMEDPEKAINQTIADAMVTYTKLKEELAPVSEAEGQARARLDGLTDEADRWRRVARKALAAGNEGDARTALSREYDLKQRIASQQGIYDEAHKVAEALRKQLAAIEDGISQMQAKMARIKAKDAAARATETATQVAADTDVLDRREQQADWQLAEAQGRAEAQRLADDPFAALEAEVAAGHANMAEVDDADVDAALAALRDQLRGDEGHE